MATVFTMIINGALPGRFLWRDDTCVSFLSINPIQTGHALIVPRAEVDHWIDLPTETNEHLMGVAHAVGVAQQGVFSPARVGQMIAGFEVPHVHLHTIPMWSMADMDFANAAVSVDHDKLAGFAGRLRDALSAAGHTAVSDS